MRKKISLELQTTIGKKSGIGWYTYNLAKGLCKNNKNNYIGEIFNFYRKDLSEVKIPNLLVIENKFFPYRVYEIIRKYINYNFLLGTHSDIYHFFNFHIPSKIKGKIIVTIHDVVFIKYPETCRKAKPISDYLESVEKSDIIITVSQNSKKEIMEYFNVDEKKIKVVPPGIYLEDYEKKYSIEEEESFKIKYKLKDDYILFLGTIEPRKNIKTIIKSFEKYKEKSGEIKLKLVVAGKKGWKYEEIFNLYRESKYKADIIFLDYIDEKDKILLYKLAKLFLFPSLYEGFGMPVLEAMAAGIPVITSNSSSLVELAGKGSILVNPNSVEEITDGIERIIEGDEIFLRSLRVKAREQAKKYTWEKSVEMLEKIYEEI